MISPRCLRHSLLALSMSLIAAGAAAQAQKDQQEQKQFQPQVGQQGKDVVWVPTPQALVDKMLDMAKVTPKDFVMDLGSGDGRTVITAAKRGARALGIEYNPDMVELSKHNAAKEGMTDKAQFQKADLFETDFSRATVITMFLLPDINLKLRPKILNLKPGTRVVSNTFTMGEWEADESATLDDKAGCSYYCTALLWIVPAKIEGTWQTANGELTLRQTFQKLQGTLKSGERLLPVNGRVRGELITFTAGGAEYTGRINGSAIEGSVKTGGNSAHWSATRGAGKS